MPSAMRRRMRSEWSRDFMWRRKRSFSSRFLSPSMRICTRSVIIRFQGSRAAKSQNPSSAAPGLDLHSGLEATMILWKRAAVLGFLSWLIPFVVGFLVFPLKQSNPPLFGNLMVLVVLLTGALLLYRYFRNRPVSVQEAMLVGTIWFAMNLIFDYPMFAYGPMKMTAWG